MKIKYLGPSPFVNVGGFGPHYKDTVRDYPKDIAEEILTTSKKQKFEAVKAEGHKPKKELPEVPAPAGPTGGLKTRHRKSSKTANKK